LEVAAMGWNTNVTFFSFQTCGKLEALQNSLFQAVILDEDYLHL
jgi:hypothetical protein